jgi:hypothetical protein
MDYQQIINILFAVSSALGGWWVRSIHESMKSLQEVDKELTDKVSKIEVLVAGKYVSKEEFNKLDNAIFTKLDRIEDKLDKKVDK